MLPSKFIARQIVRRSVGSGENSPVPYTSTMGKREKNQDLFEGFGGVSSVLSRLVGWGLVAVGGVLIQLVSQGVHHVQTMGDSIIELNKNIAVIIERLSIHEKTLERHDQQLLEIQKFEGKR